jgi:hypothetical protein
MTSRPQMPFGGCWMITQIQRILELHFAAFVALLSAASATSPGSVERATGGTRWFQVPEHGRDSDIPV